MNNYKYKCDNCDEYIMVYYEGNREKYYFYCNICLKKISVCSKSKVKKLFLLTDSDIINVKQIFIINKNYCFFLYNDIKKIVIDKYGSMEKLQAIKDKNKKNKQLQLSTQINNHKQREKMLMDAMEIHKLKYNSKNGDIYSFIHYGTPPIETIINTELKRTHDKHQRRLELATAMKEYDIEIDETIKSCYEYINNIGYKTLNDVVKNVEIEHFLKHKTNYIKLCGQYSKDIAKELAIKEYVETNGSPIGIIDKILIKVEFD